MRCSTSSLFKVRNFAITNLETLVVYAGLIGAFFFITLFLQQTVGYTPMEAGLATTPISLVLFVLSPRFGKIATGIGPRVPMSVGPIIGGIGLLLLMRVGANPNYVTEVLPAMLVFGLGLSATVAPLTATALNSVAENRVGIASGINNGVSRVAGVLAIAILGALDRRPVQLDDRQQGRRCQQLSPQAEQAVSKAKDKPLADRHRPVGCRRSRRATVRQRVRGGCAGRLSPGDGGRGGTLMIVGGVIAGIGLRNPKRETEYDAPRAADRRGVRALPPTTSTGRARPSPSRNLWPSPHRLPQWRILGPMRGCCSSPPGSPTWSR